MKILKTVLYILLAVVLVLVLLGFAGPKTYDVNRSQVINAPTPVVFDYVKSLKKQDEWGPWSNEDPDMVTTYEGEDGKVGSVSSWKSDKVGSGKQEITSISANTVESKLTFYMPWGESVSTGYMHTADVDEGTEVTWGIRGENDFVGRIFGVFMNMDKSVGPMFDEGLDSLKALVERDVQAAFKGYAIETVDWSVKHYVAIRNSIGMDEVGDFLGEQYGKIMGGLGAAGTEMAGAPCGLYYTWDETTGTTDMAAAVPVAAPVELAGTQVISLPAGKALLIDYFGAYDKSGAAHEAMDAYINSTGSKVKSPAVEEYVTDPGSEPDTAKWLTKIYYLLDQ
jgi:effector-binding domain-containing protein